MCVFLCNVWNISHSQKKLARYYHKYTLVFVESTRILVRL
jgi:hypothetical protein